MVKPGMKIKITEGPYLVYGNIPLMEKIIVPKGKGYEWKEGRTLPQAEQYALCRCGRSKNTPFCDGMHDLLRFQGKETAKREPFVNRSTVFEGPELDLLDDRRCAFARFCHRTRGNVWELIQNSDDPFLKAEAIAAANECPAGRLSAREKNGEIIEPELEPAIILIQDPEEYVSGGIFVTGNIPIESSDGHIYETRSRVALCRCGRSRNMPFCDATHVSVGYKS